MSVPHTTKKINKTRDASLLEISMRSHSLVSETLLIHKETQKPTAMLNILGVMWSDEKIEMMFGLWAWKASVSCRWEDHCKLGTVGWDRKVRTPSGRALQPLLNFLRLHIFPYPSLHDPSPEKRQRTSFEDMTEIAYVFDLQDRWFRDKYHLDDDYFPTHPRLKSRDEMWIDYTATFVRNIRERVFFSPDGEYSISFGVP